MPAAEPFHYYLRVRYGECDAQRVVFNARYADYIDTAIVELFRALGFGPALAAGELDYHLVKQTIEWRAPARFDQVLELSLTAPRLGITSFTLATEFRAAGQPEVLALAETVAVLVDAVTHQKRPLPDAFRAALQHAAAGMTVDHAGWRP